MNKIVQTWKETKDELVEKVTWPTLDELRHSTIIVLVASIVFALAIAIVDYVLGMGISVFYELLKG